MDIDIPQAPGESFERLFASITLIYLEQTSFKISGKTHTYNIFNAANPDPSMGTIGDICVSTNSGPTAAFIRQQNRWIPADLGITLTKGIAYPNCRHPILPIMRLRFDATHAPSYYWCNSSYFRTLAGRGKRGDADREDSLPKATIGEYL